MAYATREDFIAALGELEAIQLTSRDNTEEIDDSVLAVALNSADGEINSYISAVYELPLATSSPMLITVCINIARFRLYGAKATEEVRNRYDDAIRWLRDVSRGVASLGIVTNPPDNNLVIVASRSQVFTDSVFDKMVR